MNIAGRRIGPGHPAYIIAEIGVNHDGSAERAASLVDDAAAAGADAVKLQLFDARMLMSRASRLAAYQKEAGEHDPIEMLSRLELPRESLADLVAHAHALGLHALVSVFSIPLVEPALDAGFDGFKSASPDIVNRPLLDAMAGTGRPLIISTGTASLDECRRAARWFEHNEGIAFLHCVSAYPTPPEAATLRGMHALRAAVRDRPVGYSDHTMEVDTGAIAVAAGAALLEKHISYDRTAQGPDHASSLDRASMTEYVGWVRRAETMLGPADKHPAPLESDVRSASRQSVCTVRRIEPGERIAADDLIIKRPGTGVEPWRMHEVVGAAATRGIDADMPITPDDLGWNG